MRTSMLVASPVHRRRSGASRGRLPTGTVSRHRVAADPSLMAARWRANGTFDVRGGRIRHIIVVAAIGPRAHAWHMPSSMPLRIWILMFPDVQALDVTGPLEVFSVAN